jgi:tetratricopeptide (TPR) repeat protein
LQKPWDYLKLIELYREYGRHREALQWAEKAHRLFPNDAGFYDALMVCYRHDGLDEEADALLWQWFEKWPTVDHFLGLMKHAGKRAAHWRERAFAFLEAREVSTWEQGKKLDPKAMRDVSVRLEILLREKNVDEAVAISRNAVVSRQLVLMLADQASKAYPEISTPIYRREIEHWAGIGSNRNYDQAIAFLNKLLPLLPVGDRRSYLADLRLRFRAKRNFIKLLESL